MVRTVFIHEFASGGGLAGREDAPSSWKAEGSAMRGALASDFAAVEGIRVVMTLDAILADEPGPWEVVRVRPGEEIVALARLASESDLSILIAPESDQLLLDRSRTLELAGGRSLGSSLSSIALCGDKALLARWLLDRGISTPESIVIPPETRLPIDFPYPAVLKPIDGAGALDTFAIGRPDRLPIAANPRKTALLQPYVAGEPMSAAFLIGVDGVPRVVGIGHQRIEIREGQFVYRGGTVPARQEPPIGVLLAAVSSVLGLRGWVGVDFVWKPSTGKVTVLEINPRVTTSFVGLSQLLEPGTLARAWLAAADHPQEYDWHDLANRIRNAAPITFEADGSFTRAAETTK